MKNLTKLIENLTEHQEWAEANEWNIPITLSDDIEAAVDILKQLKKENQVDIEETLFRVRSFYHTIKNNHVYDLPSGDGFWQCLDLLITILDYISDGLMDKYSEKQAGVSKEIEKDIDTLFFIGESCGLDDMYFQIQEDIKAICENKDILKEYKMR